MDRDPNKVIADLVEVEQKAEEILADKQQIVELDKKRQSTRQAIRALSKDTSTKKQWVCFGNMFIKLPKDKAEVMLKKDFDQLEKEINETRTKLKPKVEQLRDLEHKDELKGFNLQPLSKDESRAMHSLF